jgi:hypothetical protein
MESGERMIVKAKRGKEKLLWRYTSLTVLIDSLSNHRITLLSPEKWPDTNDAYFMSIYRSKRELKTLLAFCLSNSSERFHFWKNFAYGSDGVCIVFNRDELVKSFGGNTVAGKIRFDRVRYKAIDDLGNRPPKVKDLPFLRRLPYRDEGEFRIIFESRAESLAYLSIPIKLDSINRIILGPGIHKSLADQLRSLLRKIPGCSSMRIDRTTVEDNERWKAYGDSALD